MQSANLLLLKNFILEKNPYLDKGYIDVWKDETNSQILARNASNDIERVFPNDNTGNYFYLRNDGDIRFVAEPGLADCGLGRVTFRDELTIQLIASVQNSSQLQLIYNLRNTIMAYTALTIIPTAGNAMREGIVISEMRGMPTDDIQAALKRLSNETIVRITMLISNRVQPNNCILNPCTEC